MLAMKIAVVLADWPACGLHVDPEECLMIVRAMVISGDVLADLPGTRVLLEFDCAYKNRKRANECEVIEIMSERKKKHPYTVYFSGNIVAT